MNNPLFLSIEFGFICNTLNYNPNPKLFIQVYFIRVGDTDVYLKEPPSLNYDELVSQLIHYKYPIDKEIALLNNYISDSELYKDEYNEYTNWRRTCKNSAKLYIEINKLREL